MATINSVFKLEDVVFEVLAEALYLVPQVSRVTDEKTLLSEAILCILSSQEKYELALSATKQIKEHIFIPKSKKDTDVIRRRLEKILDQRFSYIEHNQAYSRKIRFNVRKIHYIITTMENIYLNNTTFSSIIGSHVSAENKREIVMKYCLGLGPKQASMFLRNIGFHSEFAVLDKHILDYMILLGLSKCASYSGISSYRRVEEELKSYAATKSANLYHLDLAIWATMRQWKYF